MHQPTRVVENLSTSGCLPRDFETFLEHGTYLLPGEGTAFDFILYSPAARRLLPLSRAAADLLKENAGNTTHLELLLRGLLGEERYISPPSNRGASYLPHAVTLMMTTACQLRCSYCYAKAGDTETVHLSKEYAKTAIRVAASNAKSKGTELLIVFHAAGEPTLRWNLIEECLVYGRRLSNEANIPFNNMICTNLCVRPEKAVAIVRMIDSIIVSCDGTPEVNRATRPLSTGDSGAVIEASLHAVAVAGLQSKVSIRATVTSKTQNRLLELIAYFNQMGFTKIYFSPVALSGRGENEKAVDVPVFLESLRQAEEWGHSHGVKIASATANIDRLHFDGFACGISGANFVVMPTGVVTLCYEAIDPNSPQAEAFTIGRIGRGGLSIRTDAVARIRNGFHVSQRTACERCFCQLTCAGHCAAREFGNADNPRNFPMSHSCDIIRTITASNIRSRLLIGDHDDQLR